MQCYTDKRHLIHPLGHHSSCELLPVSQLCDPDSYWLHGLALYPAEQPAGESGAHEYQGSEISEVKTGISCLRCSQYFNQSQRSDDKPGDPGGQGGQVEAAEYFFFQVCPMLPDSMVLLACGYQAAHAKAVTHKHKYQTSH